MWSWEDLRSNYFADFLDRWLKKVYANIVRNANYLLTTSKKDNDDIFWFGPTKLRFDTIQFKLRY